MSVVRVTIVLLIFLVSCQVRADNLVMVRSVQSFPEAMLTLQDSIREHGYTITRIQRVDTGLSAKGYVTDKYRVVFLGKKDEIQYLTHRYPLLVPFLPPKISVFAEGEHTLMVTTSPGMLSDMVEARDRIIFKRWESDLYSVFDDIRNIE